MKAFVTGSSGLLGNNLIRSLEADGHTVGGLVRSVEKGRRLLGDTGVRLVAGDLADVPGWSEAMEGSDLLFHCAAYFREYYQPGSHKQNLDDLNIRATIELLRAADRLGVKRTLFVSTGGMIGAKPDGRPGDENTPPHPIAYRNLYFRSKLRAEQAIEALQREISMEIIRVLPGWMLGPFDAAPTESGQMVLRFLQGKLPVSISGGSSAVDARDVAEGMVRAALKGRTGQRYILGGEFQSLDTILATLEEITAIPAPRFRAPFLLALGFSWLAEGVSRLSSRPALVTPVGVHTMHAALHLDSDKARRELGVSFRPLRETLEDEVAWFRHNGYA